MWKNSISRRPAFIPIPFLHLCDSIVALFSDCSQTQHTYWWNATQTHLALWTHAGWAKNIQNQSWLWWLTVLSKHSGFDIITQMLLENRPTQEAGGAMCLGTGSPFCRDGPELTITGSWAGHCPATLESSFEDGSRSPSWPTEEASVSTRGSLLAASTPHDCNHWVQGR